MYLREDRAAKIVLVRSVEECDPRALSEEDLLNALDNSTRGAIGLESLEQRASYLFDRLSNWHQSIVQLAQAPAPWTVPLCIMALLAGLATNLLGPVERIHVIRNPVFLLIAWNLMVYAGLIATLFAPKKSIVPSTRPVVQEGDVRRQSEASRDLSLPPAFEAPWLARALLPGIWQFFHRLVFGFHEKKTFAAIVRRFSMNWIRVAGPLVTARWKLMLHLAALCTALGAIGGMYFRGLLQGYRVAWASTFITTEESVNQFVSIVFAPSLFVAELFGNSLGDQISVARLFSPQGDNAEAWIHLFAMTVLLAIVFPRALLALWQWNKIRRHRDTLALTLDTYYGDIIEAPVRSLIAKEVELAAVGIADSIAEFVALTLYDEQIDPRLRKFRDQGGKIAVLKSELEGAADAYSPRLNAFITETSVPEFQSKVSRRVGALLKNLESDFLKIGERQAALEGFSLRTATNLDDGVTEPLSAVVGVSMAAPIALTFATLGGGLGQQLGIAIISTVLGTTGPVGFMIGLVGGALVAGAAWWFGKETINDAITNIDLPAAVVQTALWESRFQRLIE
ncbi:MAG: DUF2868 domain-containing protein, partial [Deltaproteobacteria bacterium]|nr:DUF2868 domain-containing protein [Deltaproteobacteria bacterium]